MSHEALHLCLNHSFHVSASVGEDVLSADACVLTNKNILVDN